MKKYYAFQFWSGRNTTTGKPNIKTGRYSIAGSLSVFSSKQKRDEFVSDGKSTTDMQGNCRVSVTTKEARKLCLGMSLEQFNEHIEYMLDAHEQNL